MSKSENLANQTLRGKRVLDMTGAELVELLQQSGSEDNDNAGEQKDGLTDTTGLARHWGCSVSQVQKLLRSDNPPPFVLIGASKRFNLARCDAWAEGRKAGAAK